MAKKPVSDQMELFEDGGFKDQGNTKDPISNNPVPVGSTKKEVRDDIPANLSEGEFVLPADVVRYHGLEKIMGFRDQAKDGLQKMEQMGQMGNSDQATIPDGVPFQQMAEGGAVPVPTIQQPEVVAQNKIPGVQYVAPTTQAVRPSIYSFNQQMPQVTVPTQPSVTVPTQPNYQTPAYRQSTSTAETPKFSNLLGTQFGQLQESVTKRYVNDAGEEMYIPFVNGEPIYPIPNGFREEAEDAIKKEDEDVNKAVQSTSVRQQESDDDGDSGGFNASNTKDYQVAMQLADYDENEKSSKDKSLLGSLADFGKSILSSGIPGQVIDALTPDYERPGGFATFGASAAENKALDGGANTPSYLDSLARASGYASVDAMTKEYGVQPTFTFGTNPGNVSVVTGKPYNFAGQSKTKDGTLAFTGWDSWTDSLSDSNDSGWSGGYATEKEIQGWMDAHDSRVNRGLPGYTTLSKDTVKAGTGGWSRAEVDKYNDMLAQRNGGYIDRTIVNGVKGPNYGNFVKGTKKDKDSKVTTTTKNKAVMKTPISNIMTGGLNDGAKPSVKTPQVPIGTERVDTTIGKGFQQTSPTTSMDSGDGTAVPTGVGATGDLNEIYSGGYEDNSNDGDGGDSSVSDSSSDYSDDGMGGWTAKGGFINKRTMTMSKTPPNKKKRGGLASRR